MIPTPDLDFLAEHGRTHVIRGGQRIRQEGDLPREGGPVLVAAVATLGGKRVVGTIPGSEGLLELYPPTSPDGRYLGVQRGEMIELYDLEDGCKRWFCFVPPEVWNRVDRTVIHPSGEMLAFAVGDRIDIALPDGGSMASASIGERFKDIETLRFSACGNHLWVACKGEPDSEDRLQLRKSASLELLDEIPVPFDPQSYYDGPDGGWAEANLHIWPSNKSLVIQRDAGDSQLSVSFHTSARDRVQTHTEMPSSSDATNTFERERIQWIALSEDGTRFWTLTGYGQLCEWDWPACQVTSEQWDHEILAEWRSWSPEDKWDTLKLDLSGDIAERSGVLLAGTREGTVIMIQPGSLLPIEHPVVFQWGEVLPNGMVLTHITDDSREITEMIVTAKQAPVIVRLNDECGIVEEVYRKRGRKWIDIRKEVAWVEPRFRFERPQ